MKKKRNLNIDVVKVVAVLSVISVHFFSNTGFYSENIIGINTYLMVLFRTLFMICVPLFMISTGYLMKDKIISKKYYLGVIRVIITYLIAALIYLTYQCFYLKEALFSIKYVVSSILNFNIGYSWYIEMYIGLFLLIPFINLIYNNLTIQRHKKVLILTMLVLTSFQGILNVKYTLIPDWWLNLYPLTYYFLGCYINEYKPKLSKKVNLLLIFIALMVSSLVNILISSDNLFVRGIHNDWGSIFNVLTSILIFIFITNLNLNKLNSNVSKIIIKVSELSLGMYLASSVVDNYVYFHMLNEFSTCSFMTYIIKVPMVTIISLFISLIINFLYKIINNYIIQKIVNYFYKL